MATTDSFQLAWDTLLHKATRGIPTGQLHPMEHRTIERIAGVEPGSYRRAPERTYLAMLRRAGVCLLDQFLPDNALTMGDQGFESPRKTATTGAERTELDGLVIDAPETVVEHLERIVFPRLRQQIAGFDEASHVRAGQPLTIVAGVSVTRTLPMGRPADVKRELDWLVEHGPRTGLFLAGSSSITPGVPWENIQTMLEGFAHYRTRGVR